MMKCTFAILFILILYSHIVYGEVPFTFSAGTPAKADEVNENFNYIDNKLSAVESLPIDCGVDIEDPILEYDSTTYSEITSFPGQEIDITDGDASGSFVGINPVTIVEVPFVEFGSNDIYSIRYPTFLTRFGAPPNYSLRTYHSSDPDVCFNNAVISNSIARVFLSESRIISYSEDGGGAATAQSVMSFGLSIHIKIGSTVIVLPELFFQLGEQEIPASTGDVNLIGDIDTVVMGHREDIKEDMSSLVNYINITKLN